MELADRAIGFILASISVTIFTYYTFWVILLPFVDKDHFVHRYFLPQAYAILLPVYAGVSLICFLSVFIGYAMLISNARFSLNFESTACLIIVHRIRDPKLLDRAYHLEETDCE